MSSVWTTSAYHSRYQDTREDQVDQERTGGAQSAKTYERWGSPGRKRGGSSRQTRMASECGPMCPVGYGMNQGQGQLIVPEIIANSQQEPNLYVTLKPVLYAVMNLRHNTYTSINY